MGYTFPWLTIILQLGDVDRRAPIVRPVKPAFALQLCRRAAGDRIEDACQRGFRARSAVSGTALTGAVFALVCGNGGLGPTTGSRLG